MRAATFIGLEKTWEDNEIKPQDSTALQTEVMKDNIV